jgi:putative transposase
VEEEGNIRMPGFLKGLKIRARNQGIRQIRVRTNNDEICVQLIYEKKNEPATDGKTVMGVDLGIDNLMAVSLDSDASPFIINGRQIKSINRYYNKRRGILQKISKTKNQMNNTKRIERLTGKRNRKINDYLHKSSRKLIEQAQKKNVGLIVIGNNKGWKQKVAMGNRTNQAFVSIPYKKLIDMICYKAELAGIQTRIVEEHYTSGTSYLDGEYPDRESYNKARRIQRGLFQSNKGKLINADINAAYQIMKVAGIRNLAIKEDERVERINVA